MSRWIETHKDVDGKNIYVERIADMEECKWLMNEVCCNADSELCADFPFDGECNTCPHFEKEDGVIEVVRD